jgi:D-3-phosphoglycerate dehydrogenase
VLDSGYDSYENEEEIVRSHGYDLHICPFSMVDRDEKIRFALGAVGLLVRHSKIDADFIKHFPDLKAVVRYGVGYEKIDLDALSAKGIKLAIIKGQGINTVSDHALTLIYACARALPLGIAKIDTHFGTRPRKSILELNECTLGIIGLGRIGGTLCRKSQTLFKKILATDPYIADERFTQLGAEKVELSALLRESDVISLHCNLTDETRHLVDAAAFAAMAKVPVIINTARGPVIDEQALLTALNDGKLHSAGVDVFEIEPPAAATTRELIEHPLVTATGHYAWYSRTSMRTLQIRAANDLMDLLQGKLIDDCLNPQCGSAENDR